MTDRRMRIRSTGRWIRGILFPAAVHLVELLGLRAIRLQVLVRDRPRGREAAPMLHLPKVLPAEAEPRPAIQLGVAATPAVRGRVAPPPLPVRPYLLAGAFR